MDCWQNLALLLWLVEAVEVIEIEGRKTINVTQLQEQVELTGIYLSHT